MHAKIKMAARMNAEDIYFSFKTETKVISVREKCAVHF